MSEKSVHLIPYTLEQVRQMAMDMPPAERAHVSAAWLAELATAQTADPWQHGFAVVLRASGERIGTAGFKGPPDAEGRVEIAYGIDEAQRGRGYATEATHELIAWARARANVRLVRAHTLPEPNASTRVLQKSGFVHAGAIEDPEDGPIWRWERILSS
jgi:RimJ/RimL family protein N-acetyltransferase